MWRIRNIAILALLIITPIFTIPDIAYGSSLHIFDSNYDEDRFITHTINYETAANISNGWFPLRRASDALPFNIRWEDSGEIIIYDLLIQDSYNKIRECRINIMHPPESVKIVNGIAY